MSRRNIGQLLEIDSEIERSLLFQRRELYQQQEEISDNLVELQSTMEGQGENQHNNHQNREQEVNVLGDRPLNKYIRPRLNRDQSSIKRPSVQVNNFKIKPVFIQMLQHSLQFSGLPSENSNNHLV